MVRGKAPRMSETKIFFIIFIFLLRFYGFTVQKYCEFHCKYTEKP